MRALVFAIVLLVSVIALSWFSLSHLESSAQTMLKQVSLMESHIENNQWKEAQEYLKDMISYWKKIKKSWKIVLDHRETDEIELGLARLKSFTNQEDALESLAGLSSLRFLLEHIPAKERLLFSNIF